MPCRDYYDDVVTEYYPATDSKEQARQRGRARAQTPPQQELQELARKTKALRARSLRERKQLRKLAQEILTQAPARHNPQIMDVLALYTEVN